MSRLAGKVKETKKAYGHMGTSGHLTMANGVWLKDDYMVISNNLCQKVLNGIHYDCFSS